MADYNLGTARGRIEIDAAGVGKGLADANNQIDKFDNKTKSSGANLQKTGTVLLGGSALIAGGFALAINSAADFEKVISGIAAVSGAAGPELDKVRQKALQLGADTQYSAGEAAGAMEELIKAGLSVDDVLNGAADATVNLAAAGEVDLTTAATIASNAMNQFGLTAENMPHVADLIAGAANASAIDVNEFGMALSQSGAVANLAGLSFDDLSLAIAAMGNAGIKGSDAGTSLKTFLQNLQPTTEKQIDLMKELGIVTEDGANKFYDASGSLKPMNEIAGVLSDSLAGLTDQQKQMALETMFGSDAIRAAAVIADNGTAGFDALSQSVGKTSAADVAATRMDNLAGSIEQLKGSVETLMIIIGRPLADSLRGIVDMVTKLVNWFSSLDAGTLDMIVTVAKMVGAFLGVIGGALVLISVIEKIKTALIALKVVLLAHPLFFIIAAIIALGVALYMLYQRNETFRHAVQALFGWMADNILPVLKAIIDGFMQFWEVLTTGMTQDEGGSWWENLAFVIRDVAHWLVDVLIPAFMDFWTALTTGFTNDEGGTWFENLALVIHEVVVAILHFLVPAVQKIAKVLVWLGKEIIERLVGGFIWLKDNVWPVLFAFGELVEAIAERIIQAIGVIIDIVADLIKVIQDMEPVWTFIWNILKTVIEVAVGVMQNIWHNFADNLWHVIDFAFQSVKRIVEAALRVIQGVIQTITSLIKGDWAGVWEGIKNIFGGVWDYIMAIPAFVLGAIQLVIENAFDVLLTTFQNIDTLLRGVFSGMWEGLKGIVLGAIDAIIGFIQDLPGRIAGFVGTIFDGFKDAASGAVDTVINFFRDLPGRLLELDRQIVEAGMGIASSLLHGIIDGVTGFVGFIGDFAAGLGHAMIDWFNNNIIQWINDKIPDEITMPSAIPNINLPDDPIPWIPNPYHSGGIVPGNKEVGIIAQGGEGIMSREMMGWFRTLLMGLGTNLHTFFGGNLPTLITRPPMSTSSGGMERGSDVNLQLLFPNVGSAKDVEEIKRALSNSSVLTNLTRAVKAGVGRNS